MMRRREFVSLIGTAAISYPNWAKAEQPRLTVGFLSGASPGSPDLDGLRQGLAEGGYYEGRNLVIEYRWADGQFARLPALLDDLISRHVALIATLTLPAALAAKAAKPTTPVIFVIGEDPVSAGLVDSLNRPGSNATGVSDFVNELAAKRLEFIRQTIPDVAVIGLLVNPNNPNAEPDTKATETAARRFGQNLFVVKAANDGELEAAFAALVNERVGALCVNIDPFLASAQKQIISLAAQHDLPTIYPLREFVQAGGLMSYSPNRLSSWRQAGLYAARVLHGEKVGDLPVQQANKVELVINLKTAKALGLKIPLPLLGRADEVIE